MTKQYLLTVESRDIEEFCQLYENIRRINRPKCGTVYSYEYYVNADSIDYSEPRQFYRSSGGNKMYCFITVYHNVFGVIWSKTLEKKKIEYKINNSGRSNVFENIPHSHISNWLEIKSKFPEVIAQFIPKESPNLFETLKALKR